MKQASRDYVTEAKWTEICGACYCLSKKERRNKHESTHTFAYILKKECKDKSCFFFKCYTWGGRKQDGEGTGIKANSSECALCYR